MQRFAARAGSWSQSTPTVSGMDIAEIEHAVRRHCAARQDIAAVYLYGSRARGTARAASDVDLAVLFHPGREPAPGLASLALPLEAELERALGAPVQLAVLNAAPPDLTHRVLRDGRLLLERDASARVAFEVRSRNEYFDLEPYLREYRRGAA